MSKLFKFPAFIACLLLSIALHIVPSQALTVAPDRNRVPLNETFNLRLSSTLRGLSEINLDGISQNFDIVNRSQQSSYSIVNGKTTAQEMLLLTLAPKKTGILQIPALTFRNERSVPVTISVSEAVKAPAGLQDESIYLESSIDKSSALVGEQLFYTLAVYYRVGINEADLNELRIDGASVQALEERRFQRQINGKTYQVVEKPYALFFEKPGAYSIQGQELTAILSDGSRSRFSFDPFTRGTKVRLSAENQRVEIKSPPNPNNHRWLPAVELSLREDWSGPTDVPVGEPLSRKITLFAKGQHETTLPDIELSDVEISGNKNFNVYPEKPTFSNHEWAGGFAVQREETIVYIPTTPGSFVLPALELPWYNTSLQRWEVASIPEKMINISGEIKENSLSTGAILAESEFPVTPLQNTANMNEPRHISPERFGVMLATSLALGFFWLATLGLFYREHRRNRQLKQLLENLKLDAVNDNSTVRDIDFGRISSQLIKAGNDSNANECVRLIDPWKKLLDQKIELNINHDLSTSTQDLLQQLDKDIAKLYEYCYAGGSSTNDWNGSSLTDTIGKFQKEVCPSILQSAKQAIASKTDSGATRLKPLYPDSAR